MVFGLSFLPVSFLSRKFLETPATQGKGTVKLPLSTF